VLRALDAARALAFAARNPVRLRRVYAAAELFARDRALLLRLVPAGCGLAGVRTDYREVRVLRAAAGSAIVAAQARMRPSRLLCAGAPVDRARGTRPTQLELRLVGGASGYRVSWIRRAPR
jgi:hypothetical protein